MQKAMIKEIEMLLQPQHFLYRIERIQKLHE